MCDADAPVASHQALQFIQCRQLWATLAYEGFDPELWGQWRTPLLELLDTPEGVDLCASAPFQHLLQPWFNDHTSTEQQDAAEFLGWLLIVQDCFQRYDGREQIQGEECEDYPTAVPSNDTGTLPAKAFFSVARLWHVKVDPGLHTIDRQVWRHCHSLQIFKLPDTVVARERFHNPANNERHSAQVDCNLRQLRNESSTS